MKPTTRTVLTLPLTLLQIGGILCALWGLVLAALTIDYADQRERDEPDQVIIEARVTAAARGPRSTSSRLTVEFQKPDGSRYSGTTYVPLKTWSRFSEATKENPMPVKVRYNRAEDDWRIEDGKPWDKQQRDTAIIKITALILGGIGAWLIGFLGAKAARVAPVEVSAGG